MGGISLFTRFSSINVKVILTQTDTTVGFLSQDEKKLQDIKSRKPSKPFIKVYKNFKTLLASEHRIPNRFKNIVRRSKKTTFIVKNCAFRVHDSSMDSQVLKKYFWHYSTSANESNKKFERNFCMQKADIIVENKYGLRELSSSSLYKISHDKRKKIR
jgi:tRNA A37 threonylcarbamoyladenosine synthetase subunit TsaC/SUA5/YrdC